MDRRLFLFTQQSAVPWDWTDLQISRGARALHDLSLLTPPLVPHLHTSRGARALHDISLSTGPWSTLLKKHAVLRELKWSQEAENLCTGGH